MARLEGAYSVTALAESKLIAFRDPHGFRPLVLGRLGAAGSAAGKAAGARPDGRAAFGGRGGWLVVSETCALDLVGAELEREIAPGELIVVGRDHLRGDSGGAGGRRGALHLRVLLPRTAGFASRGDRGPRRACPNGRASGSGGAGRGRPRAPDSGLGHAGGNRLLACDRHPVQRGADQEPVRRANVHPTRPGAAPAGDPAEVQPARRGRRQAGRGHRRLDRAREHDASDRRHALRRRRDRGPRTRLVAADRGAVLLRNRPRGRGRADRSRAVGRRGAGVDRRDLARVPLARRVAGRDEATRVGALPGVPHGHVPDADPGRAQPGEAPVRARASEPARA